MPEDELPLLIFPTTTAFKRWLAAQPDNSPGAWLKFAKKGAPQKTISKSDATDLALAPALKDQRFRARVNPLAPNPRARARARARRWRRELGVVCDSTPVQTTAFRGRVPPLYPLTRAHEVDSATRWGRHKAAVANSISLNSVRGRGDRCVGQRSDPLGPPGRRCGCWPTSPSGRRWSSGARSERC